MDKSQIKHNKASQSNPVALPFWASWLRLVLKLQQNGMLPRRTKAAVADSQQDLRLIKSSTAPEGELKGRVASFELTCPALVVTWDLVRGDYCSDQPTAPPKDRRQSPHLNGCDLWSERAYISLEALFLLPARI